MIVLSLNKYSYKTVKQEAKILMNTSQENDTPFTFTIVDKGVKITGLNVTSGKTVSTLHIPTTIHGADVVAVEETAFDGIAIEAFELDADSTVFTTIDGSLFSKDARELIAYPKARKDDCFRMPDGAVAIGKRALARARNLRYVDLNEVRTIRHSGLRACTKLEKLLINEEFESLEPFGLAFCTRLVGIEFVDCSSVGDWSFGGSYRLKSVFYHNHIPDRLGLYAFSDMAAQAVVLSCNGTVIYKASELGPEWVAQQTNKKEVI